jgi:hypothetical protein
VLVLRLRGGASKQKKPWLGIQLVAVAKAKLIAAASDALHRCALPPPWAQIG